ncbi:MAG: orotidine-5'-phosphate decarboxylase [Patescibacteria group bacterium]
MDPKKRIIVAVDTADFEKAFELIEKLSPYVGYFKVGLEFMQYSWSQLLSCNESHAKLSLDMLRAIFDEMSGRIFWDGRFNDIPNTVGRASSFMGMMGVKFFNVHASSGIEAVRKAVKNKGDAKILVVTVLTSLNFADLWNVGLGRCRNKNCKKYFNTKWDKKFVEELVLAMAKWSKGFGADGVICSPQELLALNKCETLHSFLKVVPGVRPEWALINDQKRVMTPGEAVAAGADYLVIGRPITNPPAEIGGPVEAAQKIAEEIAKAEKEAGNAD